MTRPAIKQTPTPDTNPTDRDKLEPCPLCDSRAVQIARGSGRHRPLAVCMERDCGCNGPVAKWNRRPTPQAGDELAKLDDLASNIRDQLDHIDHQEAHCADLTGPLAALGELIDENREAVLTALTASGNDVLREVVEGFVADLTDNGRCHRSLWIDNKALLTRLEQARTALSTTPTMSAEESRAPSHDTLLRLRQAAWVNYVPGEFDDSQIAFGAHLRHAFMSGFDAALSNEGTEG